MLKEEEGIWKSEAHLGTSLATVCCLHLKCHRWHYCASEKGDSESICVIWRFVNESGLVHASCTFLDWASSWFTMAFRLYREAFVSCCTLQRYEPAWVMFDSHRWVIHSWSFGHEEMEHLWSEPQCGKVYLSITFIAQNEFFWRSKVFQSVTEQLTGDEASKAQEGLVWILNYKMQHWKRKDKHSGDFILFPLSAL